MLRDLLSAWSLRAAVALLCVSAGALVGLARVTAMAAPSRVASVTTPAACSATDRVEVHVLKSAWASPADDVTLEPHPAGARLRFAALGAPLLGLQHGDVVRAVGGVVPASLDEFDAALAPLLRGAAPVDVVDLELIRGVCPVALRIAVVDDSVATDSALHPNTPEPCTP
jgi:hypothetical protein